MSALTTVMSSCPQNASSKAGKKTLVEFEDAVDAADQQGEHEVDCDVVSHDSSSPILPPRPRHRLLHNPISLEMLDIRSSSIVVE